MKDMKRTRNWKEGVNRARLTDKRQRPPEALGAYFKKKTYRTREYNFKPMNQTNPKKHFIVDRDMMGYSWSKATKSVYTVLCSRVDFGRPMEVVQISQAGIAKYAGVGVRAVRDSIALLEEEQYIRIQAVATDDARFNTYQVYAPSWSEKENKQSQYFVFYTSLIETGTWARLSLSAQMVYLAMRALGDHSWEVWELINQDPQRAGDGEYQEWLSTRLSDYVACPLSMIARTAGIAKTGTVTRAVEELVERELVCWHDGFYQVAFQPDVFEYAEHE